jgi:hypothetical protein
MTEPDTHWRGHRRKIRAAIESLDARGLLPPYLRTVERDALVFAELVSQGYGNAMPTRHSIRRREIPQVKGLEDEAERILGSRNGYNQQTHIWKLDRGRTLEFGSVPHEHDKKRYQGRPHDFVGFDELPHFSRSQYRYLTLWLRSPNSKQRSRIIAVGNPPETPEGLWVVTHWQPWLDDTYPDPAAPGELRWAVPASDRDDREVFFRSLDEALAHIREKLTDRIFFDAETGEPIPPRSRTFVPLPLDENQDYSMCGQDTSRCWRLPRGSIASSRPANSPGRCPTIPTR